MTVFKTFWQVVNKYKGTIILYTVLLIVFGGVNMTTNDLGTTFTDSKPDLFIVNDDEGNVLSDNLVKYLEDNSVIKEVENDEEKINDAIFYRDINYYIHIPANYGEDLISNKNPEIEIKSTGDYLSSLAEMMLTRYLNMQSIYLSVSNNAEDVVKKINDTLAKKTNVEISSSIDTASTHNATSYFNFASYSILAAVIYIICLVLTSFHETSVNKRTIVSSKNYKTLNRELLASSFLYSLIVWIFYCILSFIMVGNIVFSIRGLIYMGNCLIFTFVALTIALLISTLINNKNAITGIVNVIALGSAFLCGAFVPVTFLLDSVLTFAHILPAYWYINTNELLATIEVLDLASLEPVIINSLVLIGFGIIFIIINNVISHIKINKLKRI